MNILSLCDGMSGAQIALKELGIPVENYYASEIDKNSIKVTMENFPDTVQIGDVTKITDEFLDSLPKIDLVCFGSPCFVGDTLVLTRDGYKEIKDVKIGDYVLSHDNKYHKVIDSGCTGSKSISTIKVMGAETIQTTSNHKFYVRKMERKYIKDKINYLKGTYRREFSEPSWKEIKELDKNYYVGYAINQNSIIPEWNGIEYYKHRTNPYISKTLDMSDENFWYIVGRYLGDGWLRKGRKGEHRNYYYGVIICGGESKIQYLRERLGQSFNFVEIKERTVYKLQISHVELANFLSQFGEGAGNKFLPGFIFDLPVNLLKSLLEGYFDSDGHKEYKNGKLYKMKVSSISRKLIYGIAQCVAKVYHRPYTLVKPVTNPKCCIEGRIVNQHERYNIEFKFDIKKQDKAFYEDGYLWCPITKVENTDIIEDVYDLTVEESHSFLANGVIVHNCRSLTKTTAGREKYNNGLKGTSGLFYDCNRILQYIKEYNNPDVKFLVENVDSNNKNDLQIISETLRVDPVLINSNLFSAQDRVRYYWANIPIEKLPESNDLVLKDILDTDVPEKYFYKESFDYHGDDKKVCGTLHIKGHDIIKRINNVNYKCPALTACRGGESPEKDNLQWQSKKTYSK